MCKGTFSLWDADLVQLKVIFVIFMGGDIRGKKLLN